VESGPEFDDFVRARSTALLRTAYALVGDHGPAEDMLQTTMGPSPAGHARGWAWR
jgi:DNA-directed RNA polymerase specialized sigma24 family protein